MRRTAFVLIAILIVVSLHASVATRVDAQAAAQPKLDYQTFVTQIEPIFLKKRPEHARCYVCHSVSTPFRLQELSPGATTWNDDQSQQNFLAVRRVVVPGNPLASKLLLMPLAEEAGGIEFHPGGKHFLSLDDPEAKTITAWIMGAK